MFMVNYGEFHNSVVVGDTYFTDVINLFDVFV